MRRRAFKLNAINDKGERYIWLERRWVDRLMTAAQAERLFYVDIVDAPPPLQVEAIAQPALAAAEPDPPGDPIPAPSPLPSPPPAPALPAPPGPIAAEAHSASVREAASARRRKGSGRPRTAGKRPPAPVPPPVATPPSDTRH